MHSPEKLADEKLIEAFIDKWQIQNMVVMIRAL